MRRRALLVGVATGAAASLAGCAGLFEDEVSRNDSRTFDAAGDTPLRVHNRNGPVGVQSHAEGQVAVEVKVRGPSEAAIGAVSVEGEQQSGAFVVETRNDDPVGEDASVALSVRVPEAMPVARVRTTNGRVRVTDVAGSGEVETENGEVTVRNVESFGGATTTNSDVNVDVPALDGDATIETDNGSVDASLSPELDAAVSASTTNGSVEVHDLDLADAEVSDTRASGTLGDGTHDLTVETANGSIDLRSLDG